MGSKTSPTERTTHVQGLVLAQSSNQRLRALIRALVHVRQERDYISLAYASEFHFTETQLHKAELTQILGPVVIEYMPMLEEGLSLGGHVGGWES